MTAEGVASLHSEDTPKTGSQDAGLAQVSAVLPFVPRPSALPTYCCECAAVEGECDHDGPRYLDPPRYQLLSRDERNRPVWHIDDVDRARMDSGSGYLSGGHRPRETPIAHAELYAMLEQRCYVDERLDTLFAKAYDTDPLKTTRATVDAVGGFDGGRLKSLGGILIKRYRGITGD